MTEWSLTSGHRPYTIDVSLHRHDHHKWYGFQAPISFLKHIVQIKSNKFLFKVEISITHNIVY